MKKLDKIRTRETTPELVKEPNKKNKYKLNLQQEGMNEIIADKKDINDEIFQNYLKYQNPSFLTKELLRAKRVK